jgi:hypothetical protein
MIGTWQSWVDDDVLPRVDPGYREFTRWMDTRDRVDALHLPPVVGGAGVVAGCPVGARVGALDRRGQAVAGRPAGYLLNLRQELGPADAVALIRSVIRRGFRGITNSQLRRSSG